MPYTPPANDTIAAIATPFGAAGIGIIRISGPESADIMSKLFIPSKKTDTTVSHRLYHGHIIEMSSGNIIDEVLLSYMKAPHSYTREDVVEINSHSGPVLLSKLLKEILGLGARLAGPGEFTFRAFINGRIDLTQAEAVMDLINTQSERGLVLTGRQLKGELGTRITDIRNDLVNILAMTEVAIDFPEEENEILSREAIMNTLENNVILPVEGFINAYSGRKAWMEGIDTVITGRVNAGKSSLMNRLLNEEKAIVTPFPGTTRDIIESTLYIKGIPLRLMDTAGIREGKGEVEKIGIELSKKRLEKADLVLAVIDRSRPLNEDDIRLLSSVSKKEAIVVLNKTDLKPQVKESDIKPVINDIPIIGVSALTGEGIDALQDTIASGIIKNDISTENSLIPNLRHKTELAEAVVYFKDASRGLKNGAPMELISVDLKGGLECLEKITGESAEDDLYDSIFSQFCLGK